jgi:pseudouridine synthase
MRINKYLASCALGSRRKSEEIVKQGRVRVNGKITVNLATDITPEDEVFVDDKPVCPVAKKEYYLLYKPRGYTSTVSDPHADKKVTDLVDSPARLFPVGRLDRDSEGLIILTNDGDFAQTLSHPKYSHEKEYIVEVEGPTREMNEALANAVRYFSCGVKMDNIKTRSAKAKVVERKGNHAIFNILLEEGRKRQIRRTMDRAKLTVVTLKRIRISDLTIGEMKPGDYHSFIPSSSKSEVLT